MLLEHRCRQVFEAYVEREHPGRAVLWSEKLLVAFEAGTVAAKRSGDASLCPYSALTAPNEFLAWLAGFRCCDRSVHRKLATGK